MLGLVDKSRRLLGRIRRTISPAARAKLAEASASAAARVSHLEYRAPTALSKTPIRLNRILVVGSCLSEGFAIECPNMLDGCQADFVIFNNFAELPDQPPRPAADYDFQLVQIPLRSVLLEHSYFRLRYDDLDGHEQFLRDCQDRLAQFLDAALRWNTETGLLTFVTNYMLPQQDLMGRLLPKHDLRNMATFVSRLNAFLSEELASRQNVHLLDIDEIAATYGRRYFQDDVLWQFNHGAGLADNDHPLDQKRLEPPRPPSESYPLRAQEFREAWCAELLALYRTIRQVDPVKLVILDLDDTLWRGLLVEDGEGVTANTMEGWPLGLTEALNFLKKRGVLLGIASKNEEQKIEAIWNDVYGGRLHLADFAVRKINWGSKAENVAEILEATNLLARNVVFVDDNPVERAAVQQAFPDIRVLGADLYSIRRTLLWSAETQVVAVSAESGRRTEMIQAQAARDGVRKRLSRAEFLETLELKVSVFALNGVGDPRFARAMELLNKSNQFNTTGRRWSHAELRQFCDSKGSIYAFEVADRFTAYGLVGVVLVSPEGRFEQFVMSCRVIGLDVETSVVAEISRRLARDGLTQASAKVIPTDANQLARDLFVRSGMAEAGDMTYLAEISALPPPAAHIALD